MDCEVQVLSAAEMKTLAKEDNTFVLWTKKISATSSVNIPEEYKDFRELFKLEEDKNFLPPHQPWDHKIKLEEGKRSGKHAIYPLSDHKLETLRKYLNENLRRGLIQESQSPAGYPVLFAPKPGGGLKMCVDYWQLNNITLKNSYLIPLMEELMDRFQRAKWYSKFDIPGAFNRIKIKKGDEWKTAFRTQFGHYKYLVVPFELTNGPATWQAYINNVLCQFLDVFVVVYLDNIVVYSKTKEDHIRHVRQVFQTMKDAKLRIYTGKTVFHSQRIHFLGYIIIDKGMEMDPKKVKAILEWPTPTLAKEILSFLGFAGFYRKFVKGYSEISSALTELTRKDTVFK